MASRATERARVDIHATERTGAGAVSDTILDLLPIGVVVMDARDLRILAANQTVRSLPGAPWREVAVIGRRLRELPDDPNIRRFAAACRYVLRTGEPLQIKAFPLGGAQPALLGFLLRAGARRGRHDHPAPRDDRGRHAGSDPPEGDGGEQPGVTPPECGTGDAQPPRYRRQFRRGTSSRSARPLSRRSSVSSASRRARRAPRPMTAPTRRSSPDSSGATHIAWDRLRIPVAGNPVFDHLIRHLLPLAIDDIAARSDGRRRAGDVAGARHEIHPARADRRARRDDRHDRRRCDGGAAPLHRCGNRPRRRVSRSNSPSRCRMPD